MKESESIFYFHITQNKVIQLFNKKTLSKHVLRHLNILQ